MLTDLPGARRVAALLIACTPVQAQPADPAAFCETLYEYAESVMSHRQNGR